MKKRWQQVALIGAAAAMTASVAALAATPPGPSQIPKTGERPAGAPQTVKRSWGTFQLSSRIAAKIKDRQAINYVFSYQASGIPLFSQQYKLGYQRGCTDGSKIYPLKCSSIAPVQTDPNQQVSQIETKLAAGQIDCISIEPATSDAMTAVTNKMMAQGIPVFTVGVTSRGHEFTNFTQVPMKEGATAANVVLAWMKRTNRNLKVFMVSGGDPAQFWAQGRMKGFRQTILKAIPGAKFVNTESNALNTSYDPGKTYDSYKAFLSAHRDIQFIENVDIGAEHANRAIRDLKRAGKVFTIGWNVSKGQLDGISQNFQVAALDQRWADQAAFGGPACAQFLGRGTILGNAQTLRPITKANVRQARAELNQVLKSGG